MRFFCLHCKEVRPLIISVNTQYSLFGHCQMCGNPVRLVKPIKEKKEEKP